MSPLNESLPPPGRAPQGVDGLLGAFAPRTLSEIAGPWSSGSSSLLLALIGRTTLRGGHVALIDAADAFDPASAAAAGTDLSKVLWVKCGRRSDAAWRIADLLVRCSGLALIACDLGDLGDRLPGTASLCRRLQRAVEQTDATLVLRAPRPIAGPAAALVVSMRRLEAQWVGAARPTRFTALVSEARVLRARPGSSLAPREGQCVAIRWEL